MTTNINDEMVTSAEAAVILGFSREAFYKRVRNGELPESTKKRNATYKKSDILKLKLKIECKMQLTNANNLTLPRWTFSLPDKTMMSYKDVAKFFGYSKAGAVSVRVSHSDFPKPEASNLRRSSTRAPIKFWSLGSLRGFETKQNKLINSVKESHE